MPRLFLTSDLDRCGVGGGGLEELLSMPDTFRMLEGLLLGSPGVLGSDMQAPLCLTCCPPCPHSASW